MIPITLDQVTEVWNVATLGFSVIAGAAVGFLAVGRYAADPAYASGEASPAEYGWLTFGLAAAIGLVFFGFQVLGTYVANDPGWTRVLSRFFVWLLYCAAIGVGTSLRIRRFVRRKHAEARDAAADNLRPDR